jgi:hypothetical protein
MPGGTPVQLLAQQASLTFATGYNGTKATAILPLNPGSLSKYPGSYQAIGRTELLSGFPLVINIFTEATVDYSAGY